MPARPKKRVGKREKITTIREQLPEEDDIAATALPAPEEYEDPGTDKLTSVLEQFGPTPTQIKVYKKSGSGLQYCFTADDQVDEGWIQSTYGGGAYVCRIYIGGEYQESVNLNIANRLTPVTASGSGGGDSQLVALMQKQNEFLTNLLTTAFANRGEARQEQTPIVELTEAMVKMHALNGGGGDNNKAFELFLKGVDFGKAAKGGTERDWKSELLDTARDVLKPAMPAIVAHLAGSAPAVNQTQGALPMAPPQTDPHAEIRKAIAYLKSQAIRGVDPGLIVDWITSHSNEYEQILQFVAVTEFSSLVAIDAEIATPGYAAWFQFLYDGLRQFVTGSNSVADDTRVESGNVGDPASHEGPSPLRVVASGAAPGGGLANVPSNGRKVVAN